MDRVAAQENPSATSSPPAPTAGASSSSSEPRTLAADASVHGCSVLRGPIEMPVHCPVALAVHATSVEAILNADGRPRVVSRPVGPAVLGLVPAGREAAEGEREGGFGIPCAVAGDRVFCTDRSGAVHRSTLGGAEDRVVASARSTSRIAAARVGGEHAALAYLASRQTSEGWVSEAWAEVDDQAPQRISEDGSGATAVALVEREGGALAVLVDARTALTAMHARSLTFDGSLHVGEDAVVFVGGPGDRRTRAAAAIGSRGAGWSLLPIARDVGSFGLATVRLDDPPRVDEPVVWSMYPNGLDPAPIAAAATGGASPTLWVARVRPLTAEPSSSRVLELGQLAEDGAFRARDIIPTTGNPADVTLAADSFGALWLAWVDVAGSWLERLGCGLKASIR